jgi:GxxExxY protein
VIAFRRTAVHLFWEEGEPQRRKGRKERKERTGQVKIVDAQMRNGGQMDIFEYREGMMPGADAETEALARAVIGAAIEVHRILGPGFPEVVYRRFLCHELRLRNIPHTFETPVAVIYKGVQVGEGQIDIFVAEKLVVELKAVAALNEIDRAQVIGYLEATKLRLGLLINFRVPLLRDGIRRVINSAMAH